MRNRPISPSISKSDIILLDLGRDFTFRGLFLAQLLPSLGLDLDALGASTDSNKSLSFSSLLQETIAGSSSDKLPDLFWSIYINNIKYIPRMARNNNYRRGWKIDSVPEKDRVYFRFSDPLYKRIYRKKSSRLNKMRTGNKTKNSSRIKIIEVASSCWNSLYELYRRKVLPATLEVSTHREFLSVLQHVRPQSQVS